MTSQLESNKMEQLEDVIDDAFVFYSMMYSIITVLFAMAVLTKFLTNEFRFGFRSVLSLAVLFIGEPLCHFFMKGPSGVALFGIGCLLVYSILPASHLAVENKAVLITGCDTGFGNALAQKLDSIGMTVFAGCLYKNGPGAIELERCCSERIKILQMDITNEKEVEETLLYVKEHTQEQGLWGLVNNAGMWYASELEMTSNKILRQVMEVNLMGMIAVTRAFLPLIRKTKGRIVNMSSVTGKVPFEAMGAYCISKHGLEAYSDVLRLEMKKWCVKVSVVQPTGYNTAGLSVPTLNERRDAVWRALDEERKLVYGRDYIDHMYEDFKRNFPQYPSDLTPVVRAICSGLLSRRPRERYPVGPGVGTLMTVFPILPIWLADKVSNMFSIVINDINPIALKKE